MKYTVHSPPEALRNYVEHLWTVELDGAEPPGLTLLVLRNAGGDGAVEPEAAAQVVGVGGEGVDVVPDRVAVQLVGPGRELEEESGLLGLSGLSSRVEQLERADDPSARLALAVFVHRLAGAVAAMTAALGGLDALVFTGGVGEHSAGVRSAVCRRLAFLGVELDERANGDAEPDVEIQSGRVRVLVLRAREDVVAAREARRTLQMTQTSSRAPVS